MGSNKFCAFDIYSAASLYCPWGINQVLLDLPVSGTIASSLAEPVVDATGKQQAYADNSVWVLSWNLVLKLSRSLLQMYLMYETLGSQLYLVLAINEKSFWIFESWTVFSFLYCYFL